MKLSYLKSFSRLKNQKYLLFIGLVLINLIVYYPSFFHVARHDQLQYLGGFAHETSWFKLAIQQGFSYNRQPQLFLGFDPGLFRPLFYFILGTELWFFRYHFMLWQITGFVFHIFVLWTLLSLLWRIRPGIFAWIFTLFFSTLYTNIEMVIWHHISSYMIFLGCLLISLNILFDTLENKDITQDQVKKLFTVLLVVCLVYDLGFLISFLFFAIAKLSIKLKHAERPWAVKNWQFFILAPGVFYLMLNLLSIILNWQAITASHYQIGSLPILKTFHNVLMSSYWWITSGLFPSFLRVVLAERIVFYYNAIFLNLKEIIFSSLPTALNFISVLASLTIYAIVLVQSFSKKLIMERWPFIILLLTAWFLQIGVIVAGRINPVGKDILANYSYYNYFFWVYPLLLSYSLVCFDHIKITNRWFNLKNLSLLFLGILIVINAQKTYRLNHLYAKFCLRQRILVHKAQRMIRQHSHEDNFSFATHPSDSYSVPWIYKVPPRPSEQPYTYLEILYPQFYNKSDPTYILSLTDEERKKIIIGSLEASSEELPVDLTLPDIQRMLTLLEIYIQEGQKNKALRLIKKISHLPISDQNFKAFLDRQKDRISSSP